MKAGSQYTYSLHYNMKMSRRDARVPLGASEVEVTDIHLYGA
jgi:hypothetical protein